MNFLNKEALKKCTKEELADALCDVLDGIYQKHDLSGNTGLDFDRCEEILNLRNKIQGNEGTSPEMK